jgi:thymidylate synthase
MDNWPPFLKNQFIIGNQESNIAVCSKWTTRERTRDELLVVMDKIALIGNLYTSQRGVDMMIRNLLASPWIKHIVAYGKDLSGAFDDLTRFFGGAKIINNDGIIVEGTKIHIGSDIPVEQIEFIRNNVKLYCATDDKGAIAEINSRFEKSQITPVIFEFRKIYPPPVQNPDRLPGPYCAHTIRAKTIADGYAELLYQIMTFGKRVHTHYDQDTLELIDLIVVITEENGIIPEFVHPCLPFDANHLNQYVKRFMSGEKVADVSYTYGNLMRQAFGVDQVTKVIKKLAKDIESRSAVISLWDASDSTKSSPCLNHLWFRVLDRRLNLTATIRSNDMFYGWPENAYALRNLQEYVRGTILAERGEIMDNKQIELGDLVIVSQSAHIYEDCWDGAKDIINTYRKPTAWWDEKGQWIIDRADDERVTAKLLDPDGLEVMHIAGAPEYVLREITNRRLVSDIGHALWIGHQIGKLK